MTELKTLKDLRHITKPGIELGRAEGTFCNLFLYEDLKQEVIKWVKEDIETAKNEIPFGVAKQLINGWIKRFNITEEEIGC